jgi:hypothetical protein
VAGSFPKARPRNYTPPPKRARREPTQQTVLADDVIPTTPGLGYDAVEQPAPRLLDQRID